MPRRIPVLLVAVAVACVALVAVAEAQVQSYPALPPPPTSCVAGKTTVQAVPDANGMFPSSAPCPAGSGLGSTCLAWPYKYSAGNGSISSAAILADADVPTSPASGFPSLGIGNGAWDVSQVSFMGTGSTVSGTIYTGTNVSPGTVSAIAKVGNTVGSCAIAGPDNIVGVGVGLAPFTTAQTDEFGVCNIKLLLDAKGCPTAVTATSNDPTRPCKVTVETPTITTSHGSGNFLGGTCGSRITASGSTCILYCPTSFGSCFQVCY